MSEWNVIHENSTQKREFHLDSNDFDLICAGVSNVGGYRGNFWYNLNCLLQTYCNLSPNEKLSVSWQFWETFVVLSYDSGWRTGVVNQYLEFVTRCLHQQGPLFGTLLAIAR